MIDVIMWGLIFLAWVLLLLLCLSGLYQWYLKRTEREARKEAEEMGEFKR